MTEQPEGPDEGLREQIAATVADWFSDDARHFTGLVDALMRLPLLTAEREGRCCGRCEDECDCVSDRDCMLEWQNDAQQYVTERDEARERADALQRQVEQAESPESIERAAREAFWTDDMGGHVKGRWTWETIPEAGRENFRALVRAVIRAALLTAERERADRLVKEEDNGR